MSDIVERLNALAMFMRSSILAQEKMAADHPEFLGSAIPLEALHEIERLREALREIVDWPEADGVRFKRIAEEALSDE